MEVNGRPVVVHKDINENMNQKIVDDYSVKLSKDDFVSIDLAHNEVNFSSLSLTISSLSSCTILTLLSSVPRLVFSLMMTPAGYLQAVLMVSTAEEISVMSANSVKDGEPHHIALTVVRSGQALRLTVDKLSTVFTFKIPIPLSFWTSATSAHLGSWRPPSDEEHVRHGQESGLSVCLSGLRLGNISLLEMVGDQDERISRSSCGNICKGHSSLCFIFGFQVHHLGKFPPP